MTPQEFQSLNYGDILQLKPSGLKILILHTNRDGDDNATAVAYLPCLLPADADSISLVAHDPQITQLLNPNLGPQPDVIGILKTVPDTK